MKLTKQRRGLTQEIQLFVQLGSRELPVAEFLLQSKTPGRESWQNEFGVSRPLETCQEETPIKLGF